MTKNLCDITHKNITRKQILLLLLIIILNRDIQCLESSKNYNIYKYLYSLCLKSFVRKHMGLLKTDMRA